MPFFSCAASEFVELFVGVGASRVRDLFEKVRNADIRLSAICIRRCCAFGSCIDRSFDTDVCIYTAERS